MPGPDYPAAIKKVRAENPDVADVDIQPSGFLSKFLSRGANASASPWTGNVDYNPEVMNNLSQDEAENTFTHELQHARQTRAQPYLTRAGNVMKSLLPGFLGGEEEYYERPREMEAYQSERNRTGRLNLRDMRDPMTGRSDINLPSESPMVISKRKAMFDQLRGIRK
jgi:hypothetical protein